MAKTHPGFVRSQQMKSRHMGVSPGQGPGPTKVAAPQPAMVPSAPPMGGNRMTGPVRGGNTTQPVLPGGAFGKFRG